MRIDPEETIAGHRSMAVRQLLRRGSGFDWGRALVENVLGVNRIEADRVMQELAMLGFIEPAARDVRGAGWWRNTIRGNALANATAAKPVRRSSADRAVQQLLSRVRTVNSDSYFLYVVGRVVLFGSYLSGSDRLGDVDVGIELRARETDRNHQDQLQEMRIAAALQSGKRFRNISEEILWPQTEVWLKLKSRSRTLSLHDLRGEARIIESGPSRVVYELDTDESTPAPPQHGLQVT